MPKTRRAGRKYQLRRLKAQLYKPIDYPNPEALHSLRQPRDESSQNEVQFLPYELTPITVRTNLL